MTVLVVEYPDVAKPLSACTVRLTSIHHPQIEGKFTATPGGLTTILYGSRTSLFSELVLPTIKYGMAPLEVGPVKSEIG
jgi:hypothetical protein